MEIEPPAGSVGDEDALLQRLEEAVRLCREAGERVSSSRQRTLELVLKAMGPVKAYDLVQRFHGDRPASAATIYRALDFWSRMGLVRRIEMRNAFVAVSRWESDVVPLFLVCGKCGSALEVLFRGTADLERAANGAGFKIARIALEARGLCRTCSGD